MPAKTQDCKNSAHSTVFKRAEDDAGLGGKRLLDAVSGFPDFILQKKAFLGF